MNTVHAIASMHTRVANRTRFCSDSSRSHNTIANPKTYRAKTTKRDGYASRLFYAYEETRHLGGFTCFLTFTYNDNALKSIMTDSENYSGMAAFDYKHLRDTILHGDFYEAITYNGYEMKYFVGCELGEGKGVRGLNNNPHYHVLLFIRPSVNVRHTLRPSDILHLAKLSWQGFDENDPAYGFRDYRYAKYGLVSESEQGIEVSGPEACLYVSKYVTKDEPVLELEKKAKRAILQTLLDDNDRLAYFYYANPDHIDTIRDYYGIDKVTPSDIERFTQERDDAVDALASAAASVFRSWRNRFSQKVRISNGLGLTVLFHDKACTKFNKEYINVDPDTMCPYILVPSFNGFKKQPLPLYFYRKVYLGYETYEYIDEKTGEKKKNVRYFHKPEGIELKAAGLEKRIERMAAKVTKAIHVYNQMSYEQKTDLLGCELDEFVPLLNGEPFETISNDTELPRFFAIYELIYKDRYFDPNKRFYNNDGTFIDGVALCPLADYISLLTPSLVRSDNGVTPPEDLNKHRFSNLLPYSEHETFVGFIDIFNCLRDLVDYIDIQNDIKQAEDALERELTRKLIVKDEISRYYNL